MINRMLNTEFSHWSRLNCFIQNRDLLNEFMLMLHLDVYVTRAKCSDVIRGLCTSVLSHGWSLKGSRKVVSRYVIVMWISFWELDSLCD